MLLKLSKLQMSFWKEIPKQPVDKILYFNQLFNEDDRKEKVNLTIGAYRDNKGRPWNLPCVNEAVKRINNDLNHGYLPPIGDKEFLKHALKIAYSEDKNGLLAGTYK